MKYRKEVDGLRAVAVSSVILFHAGFSIFRGGYVGVDIFFVISGFLITGISLDSYNGGRFSVLKFFERRSRRILPALVLVSAVSTVAATALMDPFQLTRYFESLISTFLFVSNFYFMFQSGYFDTASELKPLLHTWSLSVEEQYYILFPFVFLTLMRLNRRVSLSLIILAALGSLIAAQVLLLSSFKTEAFYLLPTRIWQLLIGVFCAILVRNSVFQNTGLRARELASNAGLLLIFGAVFAFNNNTPSPGAHALIPTVGAALILLFASPDTISGKILGSKPLIFIGLLSYSAYLWHQPLFAFARIFIGDEPEALHMLALCAVVIVLSFFSWKFVETPFRSTVTCSSRTFVFACAPIVTLTVFVGIAGVHTNGFLNQLYPKVQADRYTLIFDAVGYDYIEHMYDNQDCRFWSSDVSVAFVRRFKECERKYGAGIVILGDSHGQNFYNIVAKADVFPFVVGAVHQGCRPHEDTGRHCQYEEFLKFVENENNGVSQIIYHQSGSHLTNAFEESNSDLLANAGSFSVDSNGVSKVANYLEKLGSALEKNVVWLGPFIEYQRAPMSAGKSDAALMVHPNSPKMIDAFDYHMEHRNLKSKVDYVPFSSQFEVPETAIVEDCFIFRDGDHFSRCGEDLIARQISIRTSIFDVQF